MSIGFKRTFPDVEMYPHYNSLMNTSRTFQAPSGAMVTITTNPTGAEYGFYSLEDEANYIDSNDEEEEKRKQKARYSIAAVYDFVKYPLQDKANVMKELFRVSNKAFDSGSDRRKMIEGRCLRRAYMMSALRSFAWTLYKYCEENGKTPASVSINELDALIEFIESCNWLNYNDEAMNGICCGSDINVYFLPDSLPEKIKKQFVPDEGAVMAKKVSMAILQDESPLMPEEAHSLNKLREDLAYIYPAILTIYESLKEDRDYDTPLEGNAADILFAWCALAYSANEPFVVTDGPSFFLCDNRTDINLNLDYEKVLYDGNVDTVDLTVNDLFPIVASIEGTGYEGRNDRIENVKVGDKLIIKSDFNNKFYSPVAIEVFNSNKGSLGYIKSRYDSDKNVSLLSAIARFKDELVATVESVTPLSARAKNAKYALMDVKFSPSKQERTTAMSKQNNSTKAAQANTPVKKASNTKETAAKSVDQVAVVDDTWEITVPSGYIYSTDKGVIYSRFSSLVERNIIMLEDKKENSFAAPFKATESITSQVKYIDDAPYVASLNETAFLGNASSITKIKNTNDLYVAYAFHSTSESEDNGKKIISDVFKMMVGAGSSISFMQVFFNNSKKTREEQQQLVDKAARSIRLKGSSAQDQAAYNQIVEDASKALSEISSELEEIENGLSGAAEKLQKAEEAGDEADKRHKEEHRKLIELRGSGGEADRLTMFATLLIEKSVGKIRRNQKEFYDLYSEDFPGLSKDKLIELRKATVPKMNDEKFVKRCSNAIKKFPFEQRYGMLTLNAFNVALFDNPEKAKVHALELCKDFLDPQETEKAASLLNEEIKNIKKTMRDGLAAFDNDWLKFSTAKKYLKFYVENKFDDYDRKNVFHFKSYDDGYCYIVLRVGYLYSPLNNMMPWFWGVSITDVYDAANENEINDMTAGDEGEYIVEEATESVYRKYGNGKEPPEKKDSSEPSATEREAVEKLKKMVAIAEDNLRLASAFYTNAPQELITAAEDIVSTLRSTSADALAKFRDQSEDILLAYVRSNGISAVNSLYTSFSETSEEIKKTFAEYGIVAFSSASNLSAKTSSTSTNSSSNSSGGCYVATCVYGSYDCPQVWTLRRFRDYTLSKIWYGRLFIAIYYAISPHIVKAFGKTKWFNNLWKPVLDKMVIRFNRKGIEDTYYNDVNQ